MTRKPRLQWWQLSLVASALTGVLALSVALAAPGRAAAFIPPTITGVSPASGPTTGGTLLTVTGTGFLSGASVFVSGAAASNVSVTTSTQLTAVTPAGAQGSANVTIVNNDGGAVTANSVFFYSALSLGVSITGMDPSSGPTGGGTQITMTGTGFAAGATVLFGNVPAASVQWLGPSAMFVRTPGGVSGAVSVIVTNPDGSSAVLPNGFTFSGTSGLVVTGVSPNTGSIAGGTAVTITGSGFATGATVFFGSAAASGVSVLSSAQIVATTPSGAAGPVSVTVTIPGGLATSLAAGFTYGAATTGPAGGAVTVTSVTPSSGPSSGGTVVSIGGSGFASGANVLFGLVPATNVVVNSATQITATSPANTVATGALTVTVVNAGGVSGALAGAFSYGTNAGQLIVGAISPASGSLNGGVAVTISGSGLSKVTSVTFGGTPATGLTVNSDASITVTAPAHGVGAVSITVINSTGSSSTLPNAFVYNVSAGITLTSVSPASGNASGGITVTLTGSGFSTGMTVAFAGVAATNVTVTSATQATVTVPAHSAGTVNVAATLSTGEAATLAGGFTYAAAAPISIPAKGFGLFVFGGGSNDDLLTASGCPKATAAFWVTTASGDFVVYLPGASVGAVNASWNAQFSGSIPANTPMIGKCS